MMRAAPLLLALLAAPAHAQHEHHEPAPKTAQPSPAPPPALPQPTAAERAAAFPDLGGMDMRDHMDEDPLVATLLFDQLEWRDAGDGADGLAWNLRGRVGDSRDRLWLRSEGERHDGTTDEGDMELLWGRPLDAWWDVVAGVRHDIGHGPARDWVAVGVQGLAPYKFEVEATAYLGTGGRTALRAEAEYDVLLTNRLVLQPSLGVEVHGRDDRERRIGAGLSEAELGLRLRYEFRREFAPYAGVVWSRSYGRTAGFARADGADDTERMWVAGFRFWF